MKKETVKFLMAKLTSTIIFFQPRSSPSKPKACTLSSIPPNLILSSFDDRATDVDAAVLQDGCQVLVGITRKQVAYEVGV